MVDLCKYITKPIDAFASNQAGFNLVSSAKIGGRSIVAVVMGGTSGGSRDAQMAKLINTYLPKASTRGGGDLIAKAKEETPIMTVAKVLLPKKDAPTPDSRPEREELASAPDNVKPLKEKIPFKMAAQDAPVEEVEAPVMAAAYAEAEAPVDGNVGLVAEDRQRDLRQRRAVRPIPYLAADLERPTRIGIFLGRLVRLV